MALPDSVSRMRHGGRGWPQVLESAGQMTGPLILTCCYVLSKVAEIGHFIPGHWDRYDSVAGVVLFASTILLVARRSGQVAKHARLVEQQRQGWASRSSAAKGTDATAPVREMSARLDMCEIEISALAGTITDMCAEAEVDELADRVGLRLVRPESRRPAV